MAKCPHCKTEIRHLTFHEHDVGDVRIVAQDTEGALEGELAFNYAILNAGRTNLALIAGGSCLIPRGNLRAFSDRELTYTQKIWARCEAL